MGVGGLTLGARDGGVSSVSTPFMVFNVTQCLKLHNNDYKLLLRNVVFGPCTVI